MELDDLRTQLVEKAYLFDDPDAYAAGVTDTLEAMRRAQRWRQVLTDVPESAVLASRRQLARPALSRRVRSRNARAG